MSLMLMVFCMFQMESDELDWVSYSEIRLLSQALRLCRRSQPLSYCSGRVMEVRISEAAATSHFFSYGRDLELDTVHLHS